jgi:predicted ATPase
MKISIENFKSIRSLQNFEIKPFTVLSGVNSSGKSSFIQLLLLLKQTIELDSSSQPFFLDGELYKVKEFKDIIYNKDLKNNLKLSFEFSKSEFDKIDNLNTVSIFNSFGNYKCSVKIHYTIVDEKEFINHFSIVFNLPEKDKQYISFDINAKNHFSIKTNTGIFGKELWINKPTILNIQYSSIYPMFYESEKEVEVEIGKEKSKGFELSKYLINIDDIRAIINSFFQNISYIGSNREQPKDEYSFSRMHKNVGTKGEFVAQILEEYADSLTQFYKIDKQENKIQYIKETKPLLDAVKYWMCDIFDLAEDIKAEKINDTYKITLINKSGLPISIKHVGFGISQLLPIVVEGLRMQDNGTLIIEQPEIHLHPKIQSKLFDFLYGLTQQGKKVIVETHSSHFITRMRRRIAEDDSNEMDDNINLTFIEDDIFKTIELDDYGTLDYYPKDFIEQSNTEFRAIVKAQMNKRAKNK